MIKNVIILLLLVASASGFSQNDELFNKGNDAYNAGDFQKALDNYLTILNSEYHSAELYYNLGNAYYKLNEIAPSIYYYEKALLLSPGDKEVESNLSYAQNMTLDAIEKVPETVFVKWYKKTVGALTADNWAKISIGSIILFVLAYILFYSAEQAFKKRISFIFSILLLFIAISSVIMAYLRDADFKSHNPAIIFSEEANVKSEPNKRGQSIFTLHEGTKVDVLDDLNDWKKIRLADGETGWLLADDLKLLKDF